MLVFTTAELQIRLDWVSSPHPALMSVAQMSNTVKEESSITYFQTQETAPKKFSSKLSR